MVDIVNQPDNENPNAPSVGILDNSPAQPDKSIFQNPQNTGPNLSENYQVNSLSTLGSPPGNLVVPSVAPKPKTPDLVVRDVPQITLPPARGETIRPRVDDSAITGDTIQDNPVISTVATQAVNPGQSSAVNRSVDLFKNDFVSPPPAGPSGIEGPNPYSSSRSIKATAANLLNASYRKWALLAVIVLLIGISGLFAFSSQSNDEGDNPGPVASSHGDSSINFSDGYKLSVNVPLEANQSLIISPTDKPDDLEKGQIFLDQATSRLFYYDGKKLHELGTKSTVVNNNIQGPTNITNSTILNSVIQTGVMKLSGTVDQINVSNSTGDVTLSLPQSISTSSTPTFAGLNLGSGLSVSNGGTGRTSFSSNTLLLGNGSGALQSTNIGSVGECLIINGSGVPTFQGCAGGGGIFAGSSQTPGRLTKFDTTINQIVDSLVGESGGTVTVNGDLAISGTASGDGSGLTGVDALTLQGNGASFFTNASNISSGTLSDLRLSPNVALLDGNQTFSGHNIFQSSSNSIAAFQIQNNLGNSNLFIADTINTRIGIGTAGPGYRLDVQGGDINTSGIYRVNGAQISSANLSNDSNLAKLNGANVFTNANTFSSTVEIQGANSLTLGNASNVGSIIFRDGSSSNTGTLQLQGVLSGNVTFSLPTSTGSQTVCTVELGNCAGSGSGVTTLGGTPGTLAVFTGSQELGDSNITDDGSTVTVAVGQVIQGSAGLLIGDTGVDGVLTFKNANNSNTLTLQSGATSTNLTFTLPTGDGSNGDCLKTNGSGALSFTGCTGSGPGGGVTSINTLTGVLNIVGTANQISVASAGDTITLSLPQDINTGGNANFRTITLTGQAAGDNLIVANAVSGATGDLIDLQVDGASQFTVDPDGNVNVAGQYQVNGLQISSANLSNDSNLAKLNGTGPQVFTGDNEFTGTVLVQLDSPTALQIQNSTGTSNLLVADTTTTRIGIGTDIPGYTLDVNGDINTTGVYRINGVTVCSASGCTAAAGSGDYIQNGTAPQTADFNITGDGTIGTSLTVGGDALIQGNQLAFGAGPTLIASNTGLPNLQLQGGHFFVVGSSSTSAAYCSATNIDPNCRFQMRADGLLEWGDGTGVVDTNLYRDSADVLRTDDTFRSARIVAGSGTVGSSGIVTIRDNVGGTTHSIWISRNMNNAGAVIRIGGDSSQSLTAPVLTTDRSGEAQERFRIQWGGTLQWGDGSVAPDTSLSRSNAGELTTNGDLVIQGGDLTTNQTTANLFATNAATVNVGTAATNAAGGLNLAGGSGNTGCSVNGNTGDFLCSGAIATLATTGTQGWWTRSGTTLAPVNSSDNINTSGVYQLGGATFLQAPGTGNTFVGNTQNTTVSGTYNTATGNSALRNTGSGGNNTAYGAITLSENISGSFNAAFGDNALRYNTTGSNNTAVGSGAGTGSSGLSNISNNALFGYEAGYLLQTGGNNNVLMGYQAGRSLTTGASNLTLGYQAGDNLTTGSSNIIIGSGVDAGSATGSNQLNIGNTLFGNLSTSQVAIGPSAVVANGVLTIGTNTTVASGGIYFGTDSNLYRGGSNLLQTDDYLQVGGMIWGQQNVITQQGNAAQVSIGNYGPGAVAGIAFGSASDTNLYRSATNTLKTDSNFIGAGTGLFKASSNSTTAFQVQDSSSASLLNINTSNKIINIGSTSYAAPSGGGTVGTSSTTTALTTAVYGATSVAYNGYIYNLGGNNGSGPITTTYYAPINGDGTIGSWTSTTALPAARYNAASVVYNGYLYVIGGNDGVSDSSTVRYAKLNANGTIGSWNTTTGLPYGSGLSLPTSVVNTNYLYILGGSSAGTAQSATYYAKFNGDGTIGSWIATTALSAARVGASSIVNNGYIYEIGGNTSITCSSGGTDTVYYASLNSDGTIGSWTLDTATLADNRFGAATVAWGGYAYIFGGVTSGGGCSPAFLYHYATLNSNGSTDSGTGWPNTSAFHQAFYVSAVTYNGYVYILGGSTTGSNAISTVSYVSLSGNQGSTNDNASLVVNGSVTSGDTHITGGLLVDRQANFAQGATVGGRLSIGGTTGYNAAAASLFVGKDSGTGRSINAAGTVNASGADYAEYIPWNGPIPDPGSVITYNGSVYVVSSQETAGFVGNDGLSSQDSILVTFTGQVSVKVTGPVVVGDLLVNNGDGTAKAVSPEAASLAQYLGQLGIAQESNNDSGIKMVRTAVGTTSANALASAIQATNDFSTLNVSGTATIDTLDVSGTATIATLHITGDAKFDGPTISFSDNVRGINQPIDSDTDSTTITFDTPYPDDDYAVQCTPSYNTNCYITDKTPDGFKINFGTVTDDGNQTVDWFVVR